MRGCQTKLMLIPVQERKLAGLVFTNGFTTVSLRGAEHLEPIVLDALPKSTKGRPRIGAPAPIVRLMTSLDNYHQLQRLIADLCDKYKCHAAIVSRHCLPSSSLYIAPKAWGEGAGEDPGFCAEASE